MCSFFTLKAGCQGGLINFLRNLFIPPIQLILTKIVKIFDLKNIYYLACQSLTLPPNPPLDQWNLMISGGFQAPTGAEPPPWKNKKCKPTLDKFLNTPLGNMQKLNLFLQKVTRIALKLESFLLKYVYKSQNFAKIFLFLDCG